MIQQQSILNVSDNSGAKLVKCIKVLNGFKSRFAYVGDVIVVSVCKLRKKSKLKPRICGRTITYPTPSSYVEGLT